MIDWTGVFIGIAGLLYTVLATVLGVLWSESKINRKAIADLSERLAKEYHDADEVRQTINDLINPVKESLARIESLLHSLQNFNTRNLG